MLRIIGFIIITGLFVASSVWLADSGGNIDINWLGHSFKTSMPMFAAIIICFYMALQIVLLFPLKLIKKIGALPEKVSKAKQQKEIKTEEIEASKKIAKDEGYKDGYNKAIEEMTVAQNGLTTVIGGIVATLADDYKLGEKAIAQANSFISGDPIVNILSLENAKIIDDVTAISDNAKKLTSVPETAIIGYKNLIEIALKNKDFNEALKYTLKAYEIRDDLPWVGKYAFDLHATLGMGKEALELLEEGYQKKIVKEDAYKRMKATLLYYMAEESLRDGDEKAAIRYLTQSTDLYPYIPAPAIKLAEYYNAKGEARKSVGILSNIWRTRPLPEIVGAYLSLWKDDNKYVSIQRMEQLAMSNSGHPMNHLEIAQMAIDAEVWGQARKELDLFHAKNRPTKKSAKLMADFEAGGNSNNAEANKWLKISETANQDPRWVCSKCGAQPAEWQPKCDSCGAFASFDFLTPGHTLEEELAIEESIKEAARSKTKS